MNQIWRRNLTLGVAWGGGVDVFEVASRGAVEDSD